MLTASDIDRMTELERLETLDDLFAGRYPADRMFVAASEELGVHPKTVSAWRRKPMSIPHPVFLFLSLATGRAPHKADDRAQLAAEIRAASLRIEVAAARLLAQ